MGVLESIMAGIESLIFFFVIGTLFTFCAGMWFALTFHNTKFFWWPVYILALVLIIKILRDLARGH